MGIARGSKCFEGVKDKTIIAVKSEFSQFSLFNVEKYENSGIMIISKTGGAIYAV